MAHALTTKGQVTIPKHIRDALHLQPGTPVEFSVNAQGEVVLNPAAVPGGRVAAQPDRFEAVRGSADIRWRTDALMKLLRADD
jgi:AbrB family looped-hinge helix DNA binding protein